MHKYIAYTDGSFQQSLRNGKGAGGYASIICDENNNIIKEIYSGFTDTTNNRMEIYAVIATLQYFKEPVEITIVSDSMYVVNTINQGWAEKWFKEQDYSKSNLDLWFSLLDLTYFHKVTLVWTKGHSNNIMNNRVDELCCFAARCLNIPKDEYRNYSKKDWESLVSKH